MTWTDATLGDLCAFRGGQAFAVELQGESSGDIPFIKVSDLDLPGNETHIQSANNWVSCELADERRFKPHAGGSVVFAKIGEAIKRERVRSLTRPTLIDNNMMSAAPKPNVDRRFLRYLFEYTPFSENHGGTSLPYLRASDLAQIPTKVPTFSEQQRIAGVLGAFDDLIETNLRSVQALERLGDVLLPLASAGGESERLDEACTTIESGRRPKGGVKGIASGVPSIGAEFVKGLTPFAFAKTKFVPRDFAATMRRGVLDDMDVLVYKDGGKPGEFFPDVSAVGKCYPFDEMVINEHVFRVRARPEIGQGYLYFWLHSPAMMQAMKETGSRTAAIPGMSASNFGALPIRVPRSDAESLRIRLDTILETCLELLAESRDLNRQRDELLPLLMSGKVRVSEVEGSLP